MSIQKIIFSVLTLFFTVQASAQVSTIVENIAIGKPITSNVENLSFCEPAKALNGTVNDVNDKWSSSGAGDGAQWITVDLQESFTISRYVVKHAGYGNEASFLNTCMFELLKSDDGQTFRSVDQVTQNQADITDKDLTPFTARYVRLQITKAQLTSSRKCNIYALELYETPASQINNKSFYATEGFERFASTTELKNSYTVSLGDISLETVGKTKAMKLQFNGTTMVTAKLPGVVDLSTYTVWGMDFKFPTDASREQVQSSQTLYVSLTDANNKTATVNYPHDNSIWMMDGRPWLSWHINMRDFPNLDLKNVKDIRIGLNATCSGSFLIDNISFERQNFVLDFTKIIRTDKITESESIIREKVNDIKGAFWGTSIIKADRSYACFQAWWSRGGDFDTGGIDYLHAPDLLGSYTFVNTPMPRDFITSPLNWGNYAHNPDIVKYGDTYYLYYSSGRSSDRPGGNFREIGVAWTQDFTNTSSWKFSNGPVITVAAHGVPLNDDSYNGTWCTGVENPRMMEKDGEYYLFYKTLHNFNRDPGEGTGGRDGNYGYYLGYSIAKSRSPKGPFTMIRNSGLRGRGKQWNLYPTIADVTAEGLPSKYSSPGMWDLEDMCIFKYIDGRYYAILKDFMGRWNRSAKINDLTLFVSDNLVDWRVADFPFVIAPTRTPHFKNQQQYQYTLMERPYVFWESGFRGGAITFAVQAHIGWTSVIYPIVNDDSTITDIATPEMNASSRIGSDAPESYKGLSR
ncbi:MAG: discoidin domain-containing protein [Mediterranea sp.]|jgi:hypothetical protein|nr:discoidin domain-containing protein [Mediterranea sp.]